jgi:methylthioribose-1-phosphate isomerase
VTVAIEPLRITGSDSIEILDQTELPAREARLTLTTVDEVCEAIRTLRVRGAPLLGLTGACGMAAAASDDPSDDRLNGAANLLKSTRPTAVDLGAAVDVALSSVGDIPEKERAAALWRAAGRMLRRQYDVDAAIGRNGAGMPGMNGNVLTHCNTGALATGAVGTALAVIQMSWEQGKLTRCFATETRPLLQGARLTMWELGRLGVPSTLLPDTAVGALLASGRVSAVITGADRIAANGDTANKIGTYTLAVLAGRHDVPMYIAAPMTSVDLSCPSGVEIPIEMRDVSEVGAYGDDRWTIEGADAYNPAFDVTPESLISAIVTERGVARPPFEESLMSLSSAGEPTTG